jgi:hypothetical protein
LLHRRHFTRRIAEVFVLWRFAYCNTETLPSLYETDYFKWAMETAAALREGRLQDVDLEAAAEEIEDLGNSA